MREVSKKEYTEFVSSLEDNAETSIERETEPAVVIVRDSRLGRVVALITLLHGERYSYDETPTYFIEGETDATED